MGKKYFDTKAETLESSILGVWTEAAKKVDETNKNDKSDDGDGLDAVQPKAVKKKFKDRKDKDVDNDGDVDDSDKFLHKRRKAVSKAMKDEGNAFGKALKAAKDNGEKTFVVAGKTYEVKEEVDLGEALEQYVVMAGPGDNNQKILDIFKGAGSALKKAKKVRDDWNTKNKSKIKLDKKGKPIAAHMARIVNLASTAGVDGVPIKKGDDISYSQFNHRIVKEEADLEEGLGVAEDVPAMEVGTDRYRDYALDVTPGETDPEWAQARDFKVASMKEALAKVWGLDEKVLDKTSKEDYDEEDEELKPVKGSKTMTGGKVAKVDTKPKLD